MNKYRSLPGDIFTKLAIFFTNPTNRIIANQYPCIIDKETIYLNKNTKFKHIFKKIEKPTIFVIRNEDGEFIDSFFIPKTYKLLLAEETEVVNNVNKRIPHYFLT